MFVTKTERWLNLIAFLLDHRFPVTREEILSQVSDYKEDWNPGDATRRESTRRKFERDKSELRELGVTLAMHKVIPPHEDQEVEAYLLRPKDFYLPYLSVRNASGPRSGLAGPNTTCQNSSQPNPKYHHVTSGFRPMAK